MRLMRRAGRAIIERFSCIQLTSAARHFRLAAALAIAGILVPAIAIGYLSTGPTSDKSWFWQNPVVQGNDLRAASWIDNNTGWTVGVSGVVLKTTDGGTNWIAQDPNTTRDLTGVSFVTSSTGYAVGVSGVAIKTVDGGTTWSPLNTGVSNNLRAVSFASTSTGVAVGDTGSSTATIRYTDDGGATWRAASTTITVGLSGVDMVSPTVGWAVGGNGTLVKTVDGGASWTAQPTGTSAGLAAISFAPGGAVGYFVGNAVLPNWTVYKTINSGVTWTAVTTLGTTGALNLFGVDALDANNAALVGANGLIRRTTNGGTTWANQGQAYLGFTALRDIKLIDASNAKAIGDVGTIVTTADGGSSWTTLVPGTNQTLNSSSFVDANHGWAVGAGGTIMRTADAGRTWICQSSGIATLRGVHFRDLNNGWAVGDTGTILRTTNGGLTWTKSTSPSTAQLNSVWFPTATTGFAVGNGGVLLRSTNSGVTWTTRTSGTTQNLNSIWFASTTRGWMVGANGTIRRSTNSGGTWNNNNSPTTQVLNSVRGISTTQVWVAGNAGMVLRTTTGGNTWTNLTAATGTTQPLYSVYFTDANTGWAGGAFGTLIKTTNTGTNWTAQTAGLPTASVNYPIRALSFPSANVGYAFGDTGVVRKTVNGTSWASAQYWTSSQMNGISMASDGIHGLAVGNNATVMRTTDAGLTWFQEKTSANQNLYGVSHATTSTAWMVGGSGTIAKTLDGGSTWTSQVSGTTLQLNAVSAPTTQVAVVGGASGALKYTANGGSTWTSGTIGTTQQINAVSMVSTLTGWAVSNYDAAGSIFKTIDGGATWAAQTSTATVGMNDVFFLDANRGWAAGPTGNILRTTDGGATWIKAPTPSASTLYSIAFADTNNGWASGVNGTMLRTSNGGLTWLVQQTGTTNPSRTLRSLAFTDANHGWVVGDQGTILSTSDQTLPITSLTAAPASPDGQTPWYVTTPQIALTPSKAGVTYYSWTSDTGPFSIYAGSLSAAEGTQTIYYYSVDTASNAELVQQDTFYTDVSAPTVSTDVTVTAVTTSTADVSWQPSNDTVSGFDRYDVYVDGVYDTSSFTTSTTLTGLTPNTVYSITVVAVDNAGNSSSASIPGTAITDALVTSSLTTVLSIAPSTPTGSNGWYVTTPTVTMASLPMGEPSTIYYSWDGSSYAAYATTVSPPAGASTLYFSAHDNAAIRTDEPTRTQTFAVDTETPAAPSVVASPTSYQSILVTWAPVADTPSMIDHYDVYADGLYHSATTSNSVEVLGLQASTNYSFTVVAVNSAGTTSAPSASVNATTPAAPLPQPPTTVLAKAPTGDAVYLTWLPSSDALGDAQYRIYRSTDGATYTAVATTTADPSFNSYIDSGLRSSFRYYYAISTVDSRGESSLSSTSSALWTYTAPTTLRSNRVLGLMTTGLDNSVYLSWQAPSNPAVVGYYVYRGRASESTMTTITSIPTTSTGYFDLTAINGEKYWYEIAAVDASGVVGLPSIEAQGNPLAPYPANQPHPHEFGAESACICHATHSSTTLEPLVRFPGAEKNTVCRTCHAPVNSLSEFLDPLIKSKHPMGAVQTVDEPYGCSTCHAPLVRQGQPLNNLMRVNSSSPCVVVTDTPAGNGFCYSCHGVGSTLPMGDLTVFESSGHRTGVAAPGTGANIQCDACHESHSSRNTRLLKYEGFMVCMQCHTASASNPSQVDILSKLMLNEGVNSKHPLLPEDQVTGARMTCQNCHNTHTTTTNFPLVDPHNPGPTGTWLNPRTDEKAFCFKCHDGLPLPTSVETSPWADPVLARSALTTTSDIQARYSVNVHGFASRSGSTTTTAYLRPDMGYSYGDTLECRACHDPHGTANPDAILDTVVSANGTKRITGVLTYRIPAGGKDFRYFCNTCHIWDQVSHDSRAGTSTATFPVNCKACHGHSVGVPAGGGF